MPLLGILNAPNIEDPNIEDTCNYLEFITTFQQKVFLRDYLCFC